MASGNQIRQSIRGLAESSTIENRGSGAGVVSVGKALSLGIRRRFYSSDGGGVWRRFSASEPPPPQQPG
jgi:hypothetical protein